MEGAKVGLEGLLGVLGEVSAFDLLLFDLRMTISNRHSDTKQIKHLLSNDLFNLITSLRGKNYFRYVIWIISFNSPNPTRLVLIFSFLILN